MRSPLLFAIALSISRPFSTFLPSANAALVNRTVDDSDVHSISYVPSANWQPSTNTSCSECLKPNAQLALQQTFHYGLHSAPAPDKDDGSLAITKNPNTDNDDGDGDGDDGDSDRSRQKGKGDRDNKRSLRLFRWRRKAPDADDPNFVDTNVTASLTFTGSAFYVFCVLPVQSDDSDVLAVTNLTFLLDGHPVGSFHHAPQKDGGSTADFQYQAPVFSQANLPYTQHVLAIRAELGSMVILDYVMYSTLDGDSSSSVAAATSGAPTASGVVDNSQTKSDSKKNTATFGAAIGTTVGVLALVSLGVCISLVRRRRRSSRREKKRRELEEPTNDTSGPEMRGPQPFIPRYFPGTAVLTEPPSPPSFSSVLDPSDVEMGPSHGLNLPPAPEHEEAPAYTPPTTVTSERSDAVRVTIPIHSLPPPILLPPLADENVPPRYQDSERFPLVPVPTSTHSFPPQPGLVNSLASTHSPEGEEPPTSTTALLAGRSDASLGTTAGAGADPPTIRTSDDERPR